MNDITTIKVRKSTAKLLKEVSAIRGRRETMEQVILELVDQFIKSANAKQ